MIPSERVFKFKIPPPSRVTTDLPQAHWLKTVVFKPVSLGEVATGTDEVGRRAGGGKTEFKTRS